MSRRAPWPFVLAGCALALALLLGVEHYRSGHASLEPLLPVNFEHADHTDTACAQCHHNFLDDTGGGTCYNCHKYAEDIAADMQSLFHDFCFGCHVQKRIAGDDAGPMRACGGCHPP